MASVTYFTGATLAECQRLVDSLDTASGLRFFGTWHNRRLAIERIERLPSIAGRVMVHAVHERLMLTLPRMDARSYLQALKSFGQSVQRQAQTPIRFERVVAKDDHVHLVPRGHYVAVCGHASEAWGEVVAPGWLDCHECVMAALGRPAPARERFNPSRRVAILQEEIDAVT